MWCARNEESACTRFRFVGNVGRWGSCYELKCMVLFSVIWCYIMFGDVCRCLAMFSWYFLAMFFFAIVFCNAFSQWFCDILQWFTPHENLFWVYYTKYRVFAWLEKVFLKYFLVIKTTEYCKFHNKWRSYDIQSAEMT